MTEQEQAVVDRLGQLVDEKDDALLLYAVMRGIAMLELSPEECTLDVLRALWEISLEFGDKVPHGSWVRRIWNRVGERVSYALDTNQRCPRRGFEDCKDIADWRARCAERTDDGS